MKKYTCDEVSNITSGKIFYWDSNKVIENICNYPAIPLPHSLYFIRQKVISEDNLLNTLEKYKAPGIIIDKYCALDIEKFSSRGIGTIIVENIEKAYYDMLCNYREQFKFPFIQVIGSSGKTTTKEMVGSILNSKAKALVSYENYNSPSGVSFNVSKLNDSHHFAIFETGMRARGIIGMSTKMVRPDFVIVTSIHRAHLQTMGSIDEIIAAKSEFIDFITPQSTVIINGEDKNCKKIPLQKHKGKVLTFGFSEACDIWAKDIEYGDFQMHFKACTKNIEFNCTINTIGKYNVLNALASILVSLNLGFSPAEIQKGLLNFKTVKGRLQLTKVGNDFSILDDNFNANPDSTSMLIEEIQSFSHGDPVILVVGDFENPKSKDTSYPKAVHYEIGKKIAESNLYKVIAIGRWGKDIARGAAENGFPLEKIKLFLKAEDATEYLKKSIIKHSIVLFKSSVHADLSKLINSIQGENL